MSEREARIGEMGTFPHRCSQCGRVFDSVADLADPDKHGAES